MTPYTGKFTRCLKCGHNRASTDYHRESVDGHRELIYGCDCNEPGEHLGRTCTRCDYRWPEACLDPRLADCAEDRHVYGEAVDTGFSSSHVQRDCIVPGCSCGVIVPRVPVCEAVGCRAHKLPVQAGAQATREMWTP